MEDIARLALVEQSLGGVDSFSKILYELLNVIYQILENPHDYELRTLKSDVLKKVLHSDAFTDYLKYVGFRADGNEYIYPKEETLSKLQIAQAAIERKIYFCCGSLSPVKRLARPSQSIMQQKKVKFAPSNILITKNPLLLKIEMLFNNMIRYEDEGLQELAREQIPLVTLQLMALDRVREQQRKIKSGEITDHDLSFDIALLLELLGWFKYKFFSWVDKPACEACSSATSFVRSELARVENEMCTVEIYECTSCHKETRFPRHNDPRTLLRTRRGRCGEWANCFTLLCRALAYDTRHVHDTTDHVWCEIFDVDSNQWLHVDPCEGQLNTPLMYCHGWGKKLSYVIAVSRDDLQDVTWRYTMDHKEVLRRRNLCSESELLSTILSLREHRQRQVSAPRRSCLARRTLQELVQMMVERKPSEYESHGRISGAREWRTRRGEAGKYTFVLTEKGTYDILYYTAADKYEVLLDGELVQQLDSWEAGVYEATDVFRKVEHDWQMVYLAREEGASEGRVSWRIAAGEGLKCSSLEALLPRAEYEDGRVTSQLRFDQAPPQPATRGVYTHRRLLVLGRGEGGLTCSPLGALLPRAEYEDGRVTSQLRFDQAPPQPATRGVYTHRRLLVLGRGEGGLTCSPLGALLPRAEYEDGRVTSQLRFDQAPPQPATRGVYTHRRLLVLGRGEGGLTCSPLGALLPRAEYEDGRVTSQLRFDQAPPQPATRGVYTHRRLLVLGRGEGGLTCSPLGALLPRAEYEDGRVTSQLRFDQAPPQPATRGVYTHRRLLVLGRGEGGLTCSPLGALLPRAEYEDGRVTSQLRFDQAPPQPATRGVYTHRRLLVLGRGEGGLTCSPLGALLPRAEYEDGRVTSQLRFDQAPPQPATRGVYTHRRLLVLGRGEGGLTCSPLGALLPRAEYEDGRVTSQLRFDQAPPQPATRGVYTHRRLLVLGRGEGGLTCSPLGALLPRAEYEDGRVTSQLRFDQAPPQPATRGVYTHRRLLVLGRGEGGLTCSPLGALLPRAEYEDGRVTSQLRFDQAPPQPATRGVYTHRRLLVLGRGEGGLTCSPLGALLPRAEYEDGRVTSQLRFDQAPPQPATRGVYTHRRLLVLGRGEGGLTCSPLGALLPRAEYEDGRVTSQLRFDQAPPQPATRGVYTHRRLLVLGRGEGGLTCSPLGALLPRAEYEDGRVTSQLRFDQAPPQPATRGVYTHRRLLVLGRGEGGLTCSPLGALLPRAEYEDGRVTSQLRFDQAPPQPATRGVYTHRRLLVLGRGEGGLTCSPLGALLPRAEYEDGRVTSQLRFDQAPPQPATRGVYTHRRLLVLGRGEGGLTCSPLGALLPRAEYEDGRVTSQLRFDQVPPQPATRGVYTHRRLLVLGRGEGGLTCSPLGALLPRAEYEDGRVTSQLRFDQAPPQPATRERHTYSGQFSVCEVTVSLSGGGGAGWQRAQLGRQRAADAAPAVRLRVTTA